MPRLPPSDHSSGFRRLTEQPGLGALFLFIAALALLAPRLGTAGLWDPHEVRLLESAAEPTSWSNLFEAKAAHPRLLLLPIALGVRVFGENEMGGRAPMLALGVLTLLVMYAFGWWLASAKATGNKGAVAVLSGLVLLSTPLFFLSARHASLTLPPMLAQTLAVFGLSLLGWPRAKWRGLDLGLGALLSGVGLFCGFLCNGVLVGVAAPLLAVATALALTGGPFWPQVIYGGLCGGALVPLLRLVLQAANLPPAWRYAVCGACLLLAGLGMLIARDRGKSGLLWLSIMTTVIALGLLLPSGLGPNRPSGYSPFVAGVLHWPTNHEAQIDTVLRGLGFYFFPWVGLVPLGIVALFSELSESASSPGPTGAGEGEPERNSP